MLRTGHLLREGYCVNNNSKVTSKMKVYPGKFTVGKGSHRTKDPRLRGIQKPRMARIK